MVERISPVRSKSIAEEATMSPRRLYPGRHGRRTEEILKIKPQVLAITGRKEHADFDIRIKYCTSARDLARVG